jgi:RNA polymerase sigma-70 factor (ECF subfamily)
VLAALATLPAQAQEALRLTEWEQLDDATAARVAGCSTAAFKVRLHRARRRLARALAQQAGPARSATARREAPAANVVPMLPRPPGRSPSPIAGAAESKENC